MKMIIVVALVLASATATAGQYDGCQDGARWATTFMELRHDGATMQLQTYALQDAYKDVPDALWLILAVTYRVPLIDADVFGRLFYKECVEYIDEHTA